MNRNRTKAKVGGDLLTFGVRGGGLLGYQVPDVSMQMYPAPVPSLVSRKVISVACGFGHTLVLTQEGEVLSFGDNTNNELGRPLETDCDMNADVVHLPEPVVQITAGLHHSAALTSTGNVFVWGAFDIYHHKRVKLLPTGDDEREAESSQLFPLGVKLLIEDSEGVPQKITKISSGYNHILLLTNSHTVYSFGENGYGQVGVDLEDRGLRDQPSGAKKQCPAPTNKEFRYVDYPRLLHFPTKDAKSNLKIKDIFCGRNSSFFVTFVGGDVYACGCNEYGELGILSDASVIWTPTKSPAFEGIKVKQIVGGTEHILVLSTDGAVYSMGSNYYFALGVEKESLPPATLLRVTLGNNQEKLEKCIMVAARDVAAGVVTSHVITATGRLLAWGDGARFMLASGDQDSRKIPSPCLGTKDTPFEQTVKYVAAGIQHVAIVVESREEIGNRLASRLEKPVLRLTCCDSRKKYNPQGLLNEAKNSDVVLLFPSSDILSTSMELIYLQYLHPKEEVMLGPNETTGGRMREEFQQFLSFLLYSPTNNLTDGKSFLVNAPSTSQSSSTYQVGFGLSCNFYCSKEWYLTFRYLELVSTQLAKLKDKLQEQEREDSNGYDNFIEMLKDRIKQTFNPRQKLDLASKLLEDGEFQLEAFIVQAAKRIPVLCKNEKRDFLKLFEKFKLIPSSQKIQAEHDYFEQARIFALDRDIYRVTRVEFGSMTIERIPSSPQPPMKRSGRKKTLKE